MTQRTWDYVVSTYSFLWRRDLTSAIEEIAAAGFGPIEILVAAPHVSLPVESAEASRLRRVCEAAGVRVNSVVPSGVDVNLASVDEAMRRWSVGQFTGAARLAAELGAEFVVTHPGRRHPLRPPPLDMLHGWVVDGLSQVIEESARIGVRVLLENTPTGLIDTGRECAELVERIGPDRLGTCYDVANGHMVEDVVAGLRSVSPWLDVVHLSDATRTTWAHDPIGDGDVPFALIRTALDDLGYGGPVVIETLHADDTARGFVHDVARLREAGWLG